MTESSQPTSVSAPASTLDRRSFLRRAGAGAAALAAAPAAVSLLTASSAEAKGVTGLRYKEALGLDLSVLNFALNLEYLEAEFYTYAVTGAGIEKFNVPVTGQGLAGSTTIKSGARVPFVTRSLYELAAEVSADERMHVLFIQNTISALGGMPIARPPIDLLNSFNTIAVAAGLGSSFDPFANEANFLLASYLFEDVGVGANRGLSGLITDRGVLAGAGGILAVEAFHASIWRSTIAELSLTTSPQLNTQAQAISALRSTLAGGTIDRAPLDPNGHSSFALVDNSGLALALTARQVLNIVYGAVGATSGGFFPKGANGTVPM